MESRLPIKSASIDATIDDLKKSLEISIWFNVNDLLVSYNCKEEEISYDETIFSLWLNCGENKESAIMCDIEIDELEHFANSVLKQIEIVRRNYSEQIKFQTDKGYNV